MCAGAGAIYRGLTTMTMMVVVVVVVVVLLSYVY
jgi:hypothetical protein